MNKLATSDDERHEAPWMARHPGDVSVRELLMALELVRRASAREARESAPQRTVAAASPPTWNPYVHTVTDAGDHDDDATPESRLVTPPAPEPSVAEARGARAETPLLAAEREALVRAFGTARATEIVEQVAAREASLVEQLSALYEEREQIAWLVGADTLPGFVRRTQASLEGVVAQLEGMYADREAGGDDDGSHATITNLVAQVEALYADREHDTGASDSDGSHATITNLVAQVEALYADREHDTGASDSDGSHATITNLVAQVEALYADREHNAAGGDSDGLRATVDNLVAQIEALYGEREGGIATHGDVSTSLDNIVAQIESLYAEREAANDDGRERSLVSQVESLYADREQLQRAIGASEPDEIIRQFRQLHDARRDDRRTSVGRLLFR